MNLLGRRLGEFIIRQKLGEGGFGAVYRAYQPPLAREAVVKILHQKHHSDPEVIERFTREARLASRLEHPYTAHIYAFGAEPDGLLWIAMELVRGITLDQLLKQQGPLRLDTFTPLLERICEVVDSAHEADIVHRDLKPANVCVISRAGRLLPKLLDFGIAKAISASTPAVEPPHLPEVQDPRQTLKLPPHQTQKLDQTQGLVGSPVYMSPEQWHGQVDARADIYALGILSYEVLTGSPPFKGDLLTLIRAHEKDPLPSLGSDFPPELDQVLRRATAKAPQDRYQTALEFAEAFRTAARIRPDPLPQMHPELRDQLLATAPQPIADAVAELGSARTLRHSIDSLSEIVHACVRYIGVLALAIYAAHPVKLELDSFRRLRRHHLEDLEWVDMSSAIVSSTCNIPELKDFFDKGGKQRLEDLLRTRVDDKTGAMEMLHRCEQLLYSLQPLWDYTLVVPQHGIAISWMGAMRTRPSLTVALDLPPHPLLIGRDLQPVLQLWPLVQVAEPMAGHSPELFLFDGRGRNAARFVSIPTDFEIHDEEFWNWYSRFLDTDEESIVPLQTERSPYPGLSAFTLQDSDLFFGRERDVEHFLNRLKVESLLTVVGSSGAGKSSFVQAGVLPNLHHTTRLVLRPGIKPLATLQARLPEPDQELILVIDQFEELLTLCPDPEERAEYARRLCEIADQEHCKVILTLRDDFLLRARELPFLGQRLQQSLELLSTPQLPDLVRILTLPALRSGYDFDDPSLPQEIAREVEGKAGALPLLAFTAFKLWEKRHKRTMRRSDYLAMGGVAGALAQHAEETLAQMTPDEIELVRLIFDKLVTSEGTRALVKRSELIELLGPDVRVLERLISARLLSVREGEEIELAHEALLVAWPRLVRWRQNNDQRLHQELAQAARTWHERSRPDSLLWRGELLAEFRLWRSRYKGSLSSLEEEFAKASIAHAHAARRNRRIAVLVAGLILVSVLIILFIQRRETELQVLNLYTEQGRQELQAGRPEQALVYLSQAYSRGKRDAGIRFMLAQALEKYEPAPMPLLEGHRAEVLDVAFSPDGSRVATASADHSARLWSSSGQPLATLPMNAEVSRLAFSPDSRLLATASDQIVVWKLETGEPLRLGVRATALAFSPDSKFLASSSSDGILRLWRVADWSETKLYTASSSLTFTAFSPDSRLILIAEGSVVRVLEVATGQEVSVLSGHEGTIQTARFSPDGRRIVTAGSDSTVRIWQTTGQQQTALQGHTSIVLSAVFSPDGQIVASCGTDRTVRFWESSTGRPLITITPLQRIVNALSYDPTGKVLAMASDDQTARLSSVRLEERSPAEIAHLVKERTGLVLVGERIEPLTPSRPSKPLQGRYSYKSCVYEYETVTVDSRGRKIDSRRLQSEGYVEDLNGVSLEMVKIPAGTFLMGSPEDEFKREKEYESPQHQVSVQSFYIGRFEVTQAQWVAVMGYNPSNFKGEQLPVDSVNWHEANEFCRKLTMLTGRRYRLPTEAEWEYAARAHTTTPFHFGSTLTTDLANYDGNSSYRHEPRGRLLSRTTPVGSYPANGFGLFDMHGNLHEWCQDVLHNGYQGAPADASAWERPYSDPLQRVLRGGSWSSDPDFCRSAVRVRAAPTLKSYVIGLRVVRGE